MVTIEDKKYTNSQFSKAHLKNLNLSNFEMIEGMEIKVIASESP
jgi:hypothetical protein